MSKHTKTIVSAVVPLAAALAIGVAVAPTASAEDAWERTCHGGSTSQYAGAVCADVRSNLLTGDVWENRGRAGVQANSGHRICVTGVALYNGTTRVEWVQTNVCSTGEHHDVFTPWHVFSSCTSGTTLRESTHVAYTVDGGSQNVFSTPAVEFYCV